jgi:cytidylate kinase
MRVIAIDGPSGAGKSTVAKRLAGKFGFRYLDTGALYRATALGLMQRGLDEGAFDDDIKRALEGMSVSYFEGRVVLDGRDVEGEIRTPEVGHFSSVFSARRSVREFLMPVQKRAAEDHELVVEGRDMTTVVFPDAWMKIYLDASVDARAKRRFMQLKDMGIEADMGRASRDVVVRDERDSSRDIAPLKRADDALYIDSSSLEAEEVVEIVIKAAGLEAKK